MLRTVPQLLRCPEGRDCWIKTNKNVLALRNGWFLSGGTGGGDAATLIDEEALEQANNFFYCTLP